MAARSGATFTLVDMRVAMRDRSGAFRCFTSAELAEPATVQIVVEGSPEMVQRIADAIDTAVPDAIQWCEHARSGSIAGHLRLTGTDEHSLASDRRVEPYWRDVHQKRSGFSE